MKKRDLDYTAVWCFLFSFTTVKHGNLPRKIKTSIYTKDASLIRYHYSFWKLVKRDLVMCWVQIKSAPLTQSWPRRRRTSSERLIYVQFTSCVYGGRTITLRKLAVNVIVVDQGQQSSPPFKMKSNLHWKRGHHSQSKVWKGLLIYNVFASSVKIEFCGEILLLTFTRLLKTRNHNCVFSNWISHKEDDEEEDGFLGRRNSYHHEWLYLERMVCLSYS